MDLHDIANRPGYGTGKAARDRLAAEAECLQFLPSVALMPAFIAAPDSDHVPLAHFGNSSEDGKDWGIYHAGTDLQDGFGLDAKYDAKLVAAILNAYRLGILMVKEGGR